MERNPISREGYNKLSEEIRRMEYDELPRIAEQIALARAEGDLGENAEYGEDCSSLECDNNAGHIIARTVVEGLLDEMFDPILRIGELLRA